MKTCHNRIPSVFSSAVCGDLKSEFDHVLKHWFGDSSPQDKERFIKPRTDINESESGFEISLDLPGVDFADVHVEINDGELIVSGSRPKKELGDENQSHHQERWYGNFKRAFSFPIEVDFDQVNAQLKNGVLTLQVPKSEKTKPRQIQIKVEE